jgi:phosphoribosyl-dephospho-CoA transferase
LAALAAAAPWLDDLGLPWGPVGGVGFELATGVPVLTTASDVDLLVRAAGPLDMGKLRTLTARLATLPARFDVQLELDEGAVALAEICRAAPGTVLLRTAHGPRLVDWPGP